MDSRWRSVRSQRSSLLAAGRAVAQLETEFPSDADVLYVAANFHMKAWNDAIYRMYRKAPASYRVDQLSAEVFETQGKYAEAIAEYRKRHRKESEGHQSALIAWAARCCCNRTIPRRWSRRARSSKRNWR